MLAYDNLLERAPVVQYHSYIPTLTIHGDSLVALGTHHSEMRVDLDDAQRRKPAEERLGDAAAALLTYDAGAGESHIQPYRDWLEDDFLNCGTLADDAGYRIEVMLRRGYPCELAMDTTPLRIQYNNGMRLSNLLLASHNRVLELTFLWREFAEDLHSFSLQLVNADGERALGQDQAIYNDVLAQHRIDASALPAGDYQAKLIVYNYETGKSVSGFRMQAGAHTEFRREVDIGTISLD